jgi:type II secretory pathway component PulJ
MKRQYRIETPETERAVMQVAAMIADMERVVALLDRDIAATEVRTGILDKANIAYPPLAKSQWERQNNLKRTIAELRRHLSEAPAAAVEAAA